MIIFFVLTVPLFLYKKEEKMTKESKNMQELFYELFSEENEERRAIEKKVSKLLMSLMMSTSSKGYRYIKDAIMMILENQENAGAFMKVIYPTIAVNNDTASANVERNIRFAVNDVYKMNTKEDLINIFGKSRMTEYRPTSSEFITACAEKMRLEG